MCINVQLFHKEVIFVVHVAMETTLVSTGYCLDWLQMMYVLFLSQTALSY